MIDLRALRADPQQYYTALQRKGAEIDVDELLELDDLRKEYLQKVENLRRTQNEASQKIAREKDVGAKSKLIAEMKDVAEESKIYEEKLNRVKKELDEKLLAIPNPPHESAPDGGEEQAVVVKKSGEFQNFTYIPRDHEELGKALDLVDTQRGAKVSGSRFYYLKNEAVLLEFALVNYVLEKLIVKGFTPMTTPTLVREAAMIGTGFFPADRFEIYHVNPKTEEEPENDDLYLIGTSEVPLTMYHADEILDGNFPKRYVGFSTCYRREAGAYGKDTKGIFRVHQFDKLEMFSFCEPAKSWEEHEFLLSCEEEIVSGLGLPYRVVNIAALDLGAPAAKKYDIEVWLPSQKTYRELTSCSNCTDYQARRANVRYKTKTGQTPGISQGFVHTLNGTACAMTRMLIAILENYQNADGSVTIPEVLRKWLGKERIEIKK